MILRRRGSKSDAGGGIIEFRMCFIECRECWCTTDGLCESWADKINLIEGGYLQFVELTGVDEGNKVL